MTTKKPDPQATPTDSNRQASPWRQAASGSRPHYAAGDDVDSATPSFMSALRRFRARHGLTPPGQIPLLADDDLAHLRATDCERPGLDLDDIASASDDATP